MNRVLNSVRSYFGYTIYSTRCTLMAEVANSYLNWIWWVLEPFGNMCVYLFVFGYLFQSKEQHHGLFIYIGVTMWGFFNGFILSSINLIRAERSMIMNIYVPKSILLLRNMLVLAFKMVLSFGLIGIIMLVKGIHIGISILYSPFVLFSFFLFCYGCALYFMHFGVYVSDLFDASKILLHILMYFSGVFYSIEGRAPEPYGRIFSLFNPIAFLISRFRNSVLYDSPPELLFLLGWFGISLFLTVSGLRLVSRRENDYLKAI